MLSKSEHIRRILDGVNFDMPAADVADRLARKGVEIDPGLVHVVRSSMRKERQRAEEQRQAEVEQRRQGKEAEKVRLQVMAAKVQETKALNAKPLRQHIIDALLNYEQYVANIGQPCRGLQIPDVIARCRKTYVGGGDQEQFNQSVRKKLRLLVLSGTVIEKEKGKFAANMDEFIRTVDGWEDKASFQAARPGLYPKTEPVPGNCQAVLTELQVQADQGVRRQEVVAGTENGIAFLVNKLKEIIAKVGKKETKELIDIL